MSSHGPIITLSYHTSPGSYIHITLGEVFTRHKWVVATPIVTIFASLLSASAYTGDIRYLLITFMLMVVIVPGLIALTYFSIALTPDNAFSVLPKHLVIIPQKSITVIYEPITQNDEIIVPHKPLHLDWSTITYWKRSGNHTLACIGQHHLIIPDTALPCSPYTIFPFKSDIEYQ